jgi:hypothetical protein
VSDAETARRIAMSLPEAEDCSVPGRISFRVRGKQFAWTFMDRVVENRPRQPDIGVLAVRCTMEEKLIHLAADPEKFFTTDHYHGFPAVLVRLDRVDEDELRELIKDAWRAQVPKKMARQLDDAG